MEHIKNFQPDIEQSERLEWKRQLESTAGFMSLTPKQQQMIIVSLYGSQRAFRGTNELSAENIKDGDFGEEIVLPDNMTPKELADTQAYGMSQTNIYQWYCHAAVESLEGVDTDIEHIKGFSVPKLSDGHKISSLEDMSAFIDLELADNTSPLVLHVLTKNNFFYTALVLGQTENGEWLVWEKRGYSIAFRLATLNQVFDEYKEYSPTWVVRTLKSIEI